MQATQAKFTDREIKSLDGQVATKIIRSGNFMNNLYAPSGPYLLGSLMLSGKSSSLADLADRSFGQKTCA
jgi:hypothetical protein